MGSAPARSGGAVFQKPSPAFCQPRLTARRRRLRTTRAEPAGPYHRQITGHQLSSRQATPPAMDRAANRLSARPAFRLAGS